MTVKLILFAGLRQVAGFKERTFELSPAATVADLLALLPDSVKARTFYIAVNQEYAEASLPLSHGDEVALLPPVSGGCP